MSYTQMIRFRTDAPDRVEALGRAWADETEGTRRATRLDVYRVAGTDRYLQLVEFPSREAAEENEELDATNRWADAMRDLVDDLEFVDLEPVASADV